MKEREFIEDLEALCRQYWGKEFTILVTSKGILIRYPQDDQVDLQGMVQSIINQP